MEFDENSTIGDYPFLVASIKSNPKRVLNISINSKNTYLRWKCVKCELSGKENVWKERLVYRRQYEHCPECEPRQKIVRHVNLTPCLMTGRNSKLCGECENCFNKSFASHPKAKLLLSAQNNVSPRNITLGSNIKCWFECDKCGHSFESKIHFIVNHKSLNGCPYCSSRTTKLCNPEKDCKICFEKSFGSHQRARYWSKKNIDQTGKFISPFEVSKGSNISRYFDCECGHEIFVAPASIAIKGRWCGFCANSYICDAVECLSCEEKSFQKSDKIQFWSKRNTVSPRSVMKGSSVRCWFTCTQGHEFKARVAEVSSLGSRCPFCKHKTEKMLYEHLITIYGDLEKEKSFDWCILPKTFKKGRFDFYIPSKNIIIELDGAQHFIQVMNWLDPNIARSKDVYKMKCALNNGITVIRILQNDVYTNRYDWKEFLSTEIYERETPCAVYKDQGGRYNAHMEEMKADDQNE